MFKYKSGSKYEFIFLWVLFSSDETTFFMEEPY